MADVCVIYVSDDESLVGELVALLRGQWTVWWASDITHGDWETEVRKEIKDASVVVPVFSSSGEGKRGGILRDEARVAHEAGKPVLPFLLSPFDIPLGLGGLDHTKAYGWSGEGNHPGYTRLKRKIGAALNKDGKPREPRRIKVLSVGTKVLRLPAFVFSLSSHETQIAPADGVRLLQQFEPPSLLVSAYDLWKLPGKRSMASEVRKAGVGATVVLLDSGNYEASRKDDGYKVRSNPEGWRQEHFWRVAAGLRPDLAFSFDRPNPNGAPSKVARRIVNDFRRDVDELHGGKFPICPIVHLPETPSRDIGGVAADMLCRVVEDVRPAMVAIPERELGNGLLERAANVRQIRKALDSVAPSCPIHLLGTGNPLSMVVLAVAGADSFDGLEWCRTTADYATGYLFHFQQWDMLKQGCLHRVRDPQIRLLLENPNVPYAAQALSYNVDFFLDWSRTMQDLIHAGQSETLLRSVPHLGPRAFEDLLS